MSTSLWLRQLRNRLFGLHSRNSGRKARSIAAHRRVRPCLETLEDRLVLDAVQTVVTPSTFTAPYSETSQNVTLTANVTDFSSPGTTVNEGMVKFAVVNGTGKSVGTAVSGNVTSNGSASVSYGLPMFTNVGSYTIDVSYDDSANGNIFTDGGDTPGTLAVTQASTTTTAQNATTTYSTSAQDVTLTANVTSSAGTVDEGKVEFALVNGTGKTIGTAASGTVSSNGSASVSYGLPAFTNVGSYTIEASYSDGNGNFAESDNSTQSPTPALTVSAATTTTASDATAAYGTIIQNVTLNATVTSSAGTVDEGKVKFTLVNGTGKTIGTAASGTVSSNGSASVSYGLPAFTNVGSYTIEASYSDSTGDFDDSDNSTQSPTPALTVNAATTVTTAEDATATYSTSAQSVTLNALVTSSTGAVDEGKVKFTLVNGTGKTVGSAASGTVTSNGSASVSYGLPAMTLTGSYTIEASYSDSKGNFADSDNTSQSPTPTLTVNAATTTTASDATIAFSSSAQNVTLNATVTSSAGTVNEGTVTFTILQGTTVIGTATADNVSDGSASVSYALPAGTDAGTYTIDASYSDTGGSGNFVASSDNTHTLSVTSATAAATTTTASNATATISSSAQNVTLNATVTSSGGTVNVGTVTFTILQGATVIGTATSGNVSSGIASVNYSLPGGTAAGTYTIEANYSDSSGSFAVSSDTTHTLTVSAPATTTTASNATVTFSSSVQNVTLNATVTSSAGTVNEGTVTFSILQGTTVIGTATADNVSNGAASVSYALPAGTGAGTYTIDASYSDNSGGFASSSDTAHTLNVTSATASATTTTASDATATFNSSTQNVTLNATVTSSAGTVNEGTVTFTILQGTTVIGTATSDNVSNGAASVSYALPAGTVPGTYTIEANYNDSSGNFAISSDTTHSLTVSAAATTTTASDATATYSNSAQTVTLTAAVTSSAGTVDEGKVKFTLVNGSGLTIGTALSGSVSSSGSASVSYGLPAFTNVGSYTIEASYSDNSASGNFAASSDDTHSLAVNAASTSTTATSTTVGFSTNDQNVTLTATVTSSAGTVNEGSVTFTLLDSNGDTIGTATSGNVSDGSASVSYTLPGGTTVGSYTIDASYSDLLDNFAASSDSSHTVTVGAATSTSLGLTTVSITPNLSNSTAQVTLTAQVSSPGGTANEGVVSFTLDGVTGQSSVSNGTATVQLTVPLLDLLTVSNVALSYSDTGGSGNFSDGSGSSNLTTNFFNTMESSTLTYNSDGTVNINVQMGGQTLISFVYTAAGLPTAIDYASSTLAVTYTTLSGGDVLVSIDGIPWQLNMFSASGQYEGVATLSLNPDGSTSWLILNSSGQAIGVLPGS